MAFMTPPRNTSPIPSPLSRDQVIDRYFLEHRAKVLDVAAYLDRLDRAPGSKTPAPGSGAGDASGGDFREAALRDAIALLIDGQPHRARRILEALSDPTTEPIDRAPGKGASGAYDGPTP